MLITGEYLILDGAKGLALPVNYGQWMSIEPQKDPVIHWKSYEEDERLWFKTSIMLSDVHRSKITNKDIISERLYNLLGFIDQYRPEILYKGYKINTKIDFPRQWGLGTSSTMVHNLAQFFNINPYKLLWSAFSGSGYDIACANRGCPIIYELKKHITPHSRKAFFNPSFRDFIYFIYLNKKQNTSHEIEFYSKIDKDKSTLIQHITAITLAIEQCSELSDFESLIDYHETILSEWLERDKIKNIYFEDYKWSIKSLGSWGGDFIMVTTRSLDDLNYFRGKGYNTILSYSEMILENTR